MLFSNAVVVDFDGFLVEHSYPAMGELRDGAREFLQGLRDAGYKIIIASCRNNAELRAQGLSNASSGKIEDSRQEHIQAIRDFLDRNDLPYDWVDEGKTGKALGRAYCDDRNVPFLDEPNSRTGFDKMLKYIKVRFPNADFKREI